MDEVMIRCRGAELLSLESLTPLQGKLKDLSEQNLKKLTDSLLEHGFCFPFVVWKEKNTNWILDGHQRDVALREMGKKAGMRLPKKFPVVYVQAKSKQEAAELLLLASSQFGKMTHEGLYEFASANDLKIEGMALRINFDALDIAKFVAGWGQEAALPSVPGQTPEEKLNTFLNNPIKQIVFYFEGVQYDDVVERLGKAREKLAVESNTEALLGLLKHYEDNTSQTTAA